MYYVALPCCLFDPASFLLPSFISLTCHTLNDIIHVHVHVHVVRVPPEAAHFS